MLSRCFCIVLYIQVELASTIVKLLKHHVVVPFGCPHEPVDGSHAGQMGAFLYSKLLDLQCKIAALAHFPLLNMGDTSISTDRPKHQDAVEGTSRTFPSFLNILT